MVKFEALRFFLTNPISFMIYLSTIIIIIYHPSTSNVTKEKKIDFSGLCFFWQVVFMHFKFMHQEGELFRKSILHKKVQ